jgi:predicted DNA-binding protein
MRKICVPHRKTDRHSSDTVALTFRVPTELRTNFSALCHNKGLSSSTVLRGLMTAFLRAAQND